MNYKFTADTNTYRSKPNKSEAARISNKLEAYSIDSIDDFIQDIEQGIS